MKLRGRRCPGVRLLVWCGTLGTSGVFDFFFSRSLPGRGNVLLFTCSMLMRSDSREHNALLRQRTAKASHARSHTQTYIKISLSYALTHTYSHRHIIPPYFPKPGPASSKTNHPWLWPWIKHLEKEGTEIHKNRTSCFSRKIEKFTEADKMSLALLKKHKIIKNKKPSTDQEIDTEYKRPI